LDVNMLIYMIGAFAIAGLTTSFFLWSIITKQFSEDAHLKQIPLEEDDE
jgi:nitrogen fixation-related uncharacterized protein